MDSSISSSISEKTSSPSILSSLMLPSLVVSVLLNMAVGGFVLYSYLSLDNHRKDTEPTKFYEFMPPMYQEQGGLDSQDDEQVDRMQDKMDRLDGMRLEYIPGTNNEQLYDNIYSEDMYHTPCTHTSCWY